LETAVFSAAVDPVVSARRQHHKDDTVYPFVCSADRRVCDAADAAVRGDGICGRNGGRNGTAARCVAFGRSCLVFAANDPQNAGDTQATCTVYGSGDSAFHTYIPMQSADRQRKSAEGTDLRTSGRADQSRRRSTAAADPVSKTVRKRDSLRRATCLRNASAVWKRRHRLLLRKGTGTDCACRCDPAGSPFTERMEDSE